MIVESAQVVVETLLPVIESMPPAESLQPIIETYDVDLTPILDAMEQYMEQVKGLIEGTMAGQMLMCGVMLAVGVVLILAVMFK